jgi:tetratricopeptide (TPR) repeat protein
LALLLCLAPVDNAVGAERLFQLAGKVLQQDRKPFRRPLPVVFLQGALTPFSVHTVAALGGGFSFKKLRPGTYTMMVVVPYAGEMVQTIEIGPSFADSKGRVATTVVFERTIQKPSHAVSVGTLTVPDSAKAEYLKAWDRFAKHDLPGGIQHLKKAIAIAPQFSAALNYLGTIAYQSRDYSLAESYFRQALAQEPASYAPLVNLGGALLSGRKVQESLKYNLLAVQARPEDALAHSQLGQSHFLLGQLDLAEVELRKAVSLDPSHFSYPQLILAQIYMLKQNPAMAIQELEEFLKLHPDSDRTPNLLKAIQELRGK